MNTRAIAARCLQRVVYEGQSLTDVLQHPTIQNLDQRDQALIRDLCFGCTRWHGRLGAILRHMLAKPLKKADRDVECLLRVGLYQLLYQRTPDHAAVNENVKAARKLRKVWAGGLVNGVLRSFLRDKEEILAETNTVESARYSFPTWLAKRLKTAYPKNWQQVMDASNEHPPLTLRVNQRHYSADAYHALLLNEGLPATHVDGVPSALILAKAVPVSQLPAFDKGAVSVQDAAAQLAAYLLDAQPGERVLDACAAPGGKTGHLLERTDDINVLALDSSEHRLRQVTDNLQRLNLVAEIKAADAADTNTWWDGQGFDRILLDAPCSATGVIRRHPDIKLLRKDKDIEALQRTQQELLQALWSTLKPGGTLLYATCSILPDENNLQIERFMQDNNDVEHKPLEADWGRALNFGRQILPGERGMDGFYYALLHKVGEPHTAMPESTP